MIYREPFAPLPADINKYTRGKLILVVGSASYTGAAALASCAAERMGAGYTEVVTACEAVAVVRQASMSLVVHDRSTWSVQSLKPSTQSHPCAVGIGSGFEGSDEERALTYEVLQQAECPVLVDGMALSFMGKKKARKILDWRKEQGLATIFTPHGGEAARLAQAADIQLDQSDPAANVQLLATTYNVLLVLKGPQTFISDGEKITPMTAGTPALAKAGTGDVLAGMISSLLAQGIEPFEAAVVATTAHALAGREASSRFTEISVIASDLISFIPLALMALQTDQSEFLNTRDE